MALPHYSEDATQRKGKNFEPVQGNLFEVTLLPPAGVGAKDPLYLQHVKSIRSSCVSERRICRCFEFFHHRCVKNCRSILSFFT